jgi:hypothetical protein
MGHHVQPVSDKDGQGGQQENLFWVERKTFLSHVSHVSVSRLGGFV